MSDEIPTAKSRRTPKEEQSAATIDVVETPGAVDTPAVVEATPAVDTPAVIDTPAEVPVLVAPPTEVPVQPPVLAQVPTPTEAQADGIATGVVSAAVAGSAMAGQVVYVTAPIPPRVRGNRIIGSLLAILGAVIFAGVYGTVSGLIIDLQSGDFFGPTFGSFLGSAFFWVPGLVFLVGLVVLTLILNRAGWWAHVLGSLVLAIAVYFGMIGVLLLIGNVFHGSPRPITFAQLAINPWVIAAAIVAREVSIWIGLAIAARGRRVKARNLETRSAFDREQQEKKAEYERRASAEAA